MSTLTGDPKANSLLDFISIAESDGDYNVIEGEIPFNHEERDFSTMTIAQVYDLQRQMIADGKASSAVGRYQFVQRTLTALVQLAKMDGPENFLFTPQTQDTLAVQDLTGRGYLRWLDGQISDETFAHNLSCEWASLPDPFNGGKSHYDGVGPNHAGQTLDAVYGALAACKNA